MSVEQRVMSVTLVSMFIFLHKTTG